MKILIIGSSGAVGSSIYNELIKNKTNKIYGTVRNKASFLKAYPKALKKNIFEIDLKADNIRLNHKNFDIVISAAAITPGKSEDFEDNKFIAKGIIKLLKGISFRSFFFLSTGSVYQNSFGDKKEDAIKTSSGYGLSILEYEEILKREFKKVNILRLFYVYGTKNNDKTLISTIRKKICNKQNITVFKNFDNYYFNPTYFIDILFVILKLHNLDIMGETINVAGNKINFKTFLQIIFKTESKPFKVEVTPFMKPPITANKQKLLALIPDIHFTKFSLKAISNEK